MAGMGAGDGQEARVDVGQGRRLVAQGSGWAGCLCVALGVGAGRLGLLLDVARTDAHTHSSSGCVARVLQLACAVVCIL